jgi:hypothetical protein
MRQVYNESVIPRWRDKRAQAREELDYIEFLLYDSTTYTSSMMTMPEDSAPSNEIGFAP